MRNLTIAAGLFGLSLCVVQAAAAADRNPSAHVHGVSVLNIAVEGKRVTAELISPGADIVGFEGKPETDEARAAVKWAAGILRDGPAILGLPEAAKCRFTEAEVESGLMETDGHGHGKKHDDHKGHGHDKKHDDHKGHGHGKKHDHEEEAHAEFRVHYHITCAAPDRLSYVEVRAFRKFPNMQEVELQAITPKGQGAAELTPDKPRFAF